MMTTGVEEDENRAGELAQLSTDIRRIARRYYDLTGKPLGVTGEVAEMEAARLLGLTLASARQPGWDATRTLPDGTIERIQIKGRWQMNGPRSTGRVGAIDLTHDFDSVYLVLMDAEFEVRTIHRRSRADVERMLRADGSRARNVRGQLSVGAFVRGADQLWPIVTATATGRGVGWMEDVVDALQRPGFLANLCGARKAEEFNVREKVLEEIVAQAVRQRSETRSVQLTSRLGAALGVVGNTYPLDTRPDIVFETPEGVEIIEVKSGRADYARFDCVVGKGMRGFLDSIGEMDVQPWEVEQDLIRLMTVFDVSPTIQRAHLVLVDAYAGSGRSWTSAFGSADALVALARTEFVHKHAARIVAQTHITHITGDGIQARVIHCEITRS